MKTDEQKTDEQKTDELTRVEKAAQRMLLRLLDRDEVQAKVAAIASGKPRPAAKAKS